MADNYDQFSMDADHIRAAAALIHRALHVAQLQGPENALVLSIALVTPAAEMIAKGELNRKDFVATMCDPQRWEQAIQLANVLYNPDADVEDLEDVGIEVTKTLRKDMN